MRLYLDAIETRLKRFHGQDSNVYRAFRDACKHEFDTYCSYRFAYKLRNYAQHLGMPISHIRTNASQEHAGDPIEFAADISFNARELLAEGGDIWGPVRRDLERASESIAVLTVFGDFPNHLRRIRNAVLAVERPFLEKLKASVSELLDCVPSGPGVRQIGEYVDADGRLAIDFVDSVHALLGTLQPAIVDDEE